jgi:hypothetical protein
MFKKSSRIIASLIAVSTFGLLATGSVDEETVSDTGGSSTTSEATSGSSGGGSGGSKVALGQSKSVRDDRAITVTRSEFYDSLGGDDFTDPLESKGGKLLAVFMTVKNTGNESGDLFWSDFQVVDSQDRKYDEIADFEEMMTVSMWADNQGLDDPGDQLFPGAEANVVVVFRVAPDASNLVLDVNGNRFALN